MAGVPIIKKPSLVLLNKIQVGIGDSFKPVGNRSGCLRSSFQTLLEPLCVVDYKIDEEIIFAVEIEIKSADRESRPFHDLFDSKGRKALFVDKLVGGFDQPLPNFWIRSSQSPPLASSRFDSFDILQLPP